MFCVIGRYLVPMSNKECKISRANYNVISCSENIFFLLLENHRTYLVQTLYS